MIFIFFLGLGIAIFGGYIFTRTGRIVLPGILILVGVSIALVGLYKFLVPEMGSRDVLLFLATLFIASIVSGLVGRGLIRILRISISGRFLYLLVGLPTFFIVWMALERIFPP